MLMRILILAAGVGSRLRPFTELIPKPLLPLGRTSILERLLSQLKVSFIDEEVFVNCSYLGELITEFISTQPILNRPKIIWEPEPLGTAVTTLNLFKSNPSQGLLVIHGDLVLGDDALRVISNLVKTEPESFIMVHERPLNRARSIVSVENSIVIGIEEVGIGHDKALSGLKNVLVNSGVLFFAPESLNNISVPKKGTEISPYLIHELSKDRNLGFNLWKWERVAVDSVASYQEAIELASKER